MAEATYGPALELAIKNAEDDVVELDSQMNWWLAGGVFATHMKRETP